MKIITFDMSINGNMLNAVDMQNYFGCDLIVLEQKPIRYFNVSKGIYRPFRCFITNKIPDDDVFIIDYKAFLYILENSVSFGCDKMIVMDCLELTLQQLDMTYHKYYKKISNMECLFEGLFPKTEIQFLMPKNNFDIFDLGFPCDVFHKKINFDIMNFPSFMDDNFVYRPDVDNSVLLSCYSEANECDLGKDLFKSKNFIYQRRSTLGFIEQFGRMVFELYYTNRDIWTVGDIFDGNDGLTEHLRLLDASVIDSKLYIPNIEDINMNNYNYMDKYL